LKAALASIGAAIQTYPSGRGAVAWTQAIRFHLSQEPDAPLLLIDEAHHLCDAAAEEIRAIFDAVPALGVVFIGGPELRERWTGRPWAQLTSRVFQRMDLDGPMPADVDAICQAANIEGKRQRDLMQRAAAKPGGLRVVRKLIDVAATLAGAGQPIKPEHIEAAVRDRAELAQ
jgi:DNA transposition AAA+ family ATPase